MSARPPHPGCADTRTRIHPKGQGSGSCPARGRTTPAKGGRNPAPARAGRGPRAGGLRRSGRRRQFPRNGRHGQGRVADPPIIGPTTASTSSGFSIGPDADAGAWSFSRSPSVCSRTIGTSRSEPALGIGGHTILDAARLPPGGSDFVRIADRGRAQEYCGVGVCLLAGAGVAAPRG